MDKETITMRCIRCSRQHRIMDMVMDSSGKGMACRPCAGLAPKKVDSPFKRVETHKEPSDRALYRCADCRFQFRSSNPPERVHCGYCGGTNILTERETSADRILQEASHRRFER